MSKHFRIETEIHSLFYYCCLVVLLWHVVKITDFSIKKKKDDKKSSAWGYIVIHIVLLMRWQVLSEMTNPSKDEWYCFWKYFFQDFFSLEKKCAFSLRRILGYWYSTHIISEFSKSIEKEIKFYHRESSTNQNSEIMG